jgi:hypothetical protein
MDSWRNVLFACGRLFGNSLANNFERIAIRSDFKKRIPRDSHVAINPFPIVELDDCLTRDEFVLWVDDLPFSGRRIHRSPQFITSITLLSWPGPYGASEPFVNDGWSATVRAARPSPGWTPGVSLVSPCGALDVGFPHFPSLDGRAEKWRQGDSQRRRS